MTGRGGLAKARSLREGGLGLAGAPCFRGARLGGDSGRDASGAVWGRQASSTVYTATFLRERPRLKRSVCQELESAARLPGAEPALGVAALVPTGPAAEGLRPSCALRPLSPWLSCVQGRTGGWACGGMWLPPPRLFLFWERRQLTLPRVF